MVRIYVQNVLKAFYLQYPSFTMFKPFREQIFLLQCIYIKINFNIWRKWRGYVATLTHVDFFFQSAYYILKVILINKRYFVQLSFVIRFSDD